MWSKFVKYGDKFFSVLDKFLYFIGCLIVVISMFEPEFLSKPATKYEYYFALGFAMMAYFKKRED